LEGAVIFLVSLAYGVSILVGHPHNRGLALFGAGLGLLAGACLALSGRSLRRGSSRTWSPALVAQLLLIPVGIGLAQGGQGVIAVLVLVPAALVALLLLLGAPRPER